MVVGASFAWAGCGSSGGNTTVVAGDSGTTDTPSVTTDTPSTPTDTPSTPTDRPSTTPDSGMSFGTCGMTSVSCLCRAGMSAMAQSACFASNMDCGQCFSDAIQTCCPMQVQAVQDCAMRNMCMDANCAQMRCMTEYAAIGTCFQTAQMSNAACQRALGGCFGSFPLMCPGA